MSEPFWEPLAASPAGSGLPPVVNGQWLKGVGGAAVWQPLAIVDADVAAGAGIAGSKINPAFAATVTTPGYVDSVQGATHAEIGVDVGSLATLNTNVMGMWFDTANSVGRLEAVTGGVAWRSIWAGLNAPFKVGAAPMRAHRHPYGNDRHIESGQAVIGGGGTVVVAFTDAFASSPSVTVNEVNASPVPVTIGLPTTTSVQIFASLVGAAVCWIAEGPD